MVAVGQIGGERAAAFQRRVAGLAPNRVLLVGVDVVTHLGPPAFMVVVTQVVRGLRGRRSTRRAGLADSMHVATEKCAFPEVRTGPYAPLSLA